MQKIFFIIIIITFFLIKPTTITFAQSFPFGIGDRLTYEVTLLGFKIGTQTDVVIGKEIINGKETYHIRSEIKSNPFFSKFYYLSEQIDTWVETSTLLPVRVIKNIDRKKYHKYYAFSIDHTNRKATILSKHRNTTKTINILPNTLDPLSLIYYLRNQDLKIGNSYTLAVLTTDEAKQVKVDIVKEEVILTPLGKYMTLKAKQSNSDVIVWFTKDKRHIPVKIEINTKVGRLKAYLCRKE